MTRLITWLLNAWVVSRRIFQPAAADPTRPFQRLSDWRARLGIVVIVWLSLPYLSAAEIANKITLNWLYSLSMGAFWAVAAVSICWLTALPLNALAAREAEAVVKRGLLAVAVTVGGTVAGRFPVVPAVIGIGVILAILLLWLLIFTIAMMWNCLRWVFGVGDVDRRLGPIVTVLTAITALVISKVLNAPDGRPASLQTLLDVGALSTISILAAVEWHFLSRVESRKSPVDWRLRQTPPPPARSGPLNKSAMAAVSLILLPPIAIPLAFRALPVINATGERGMGLAVTTLIVDITAIEIAFFTVFRF